MTMDPFHRPAAQVRRGRVVVCLVALVLMSGAAQAQTKTPAGLDHDNGRYAFYETAGDVLRLDTRTGKVSTCRKSGDTGWACYAMADDRAALEEEIARLQGENARLKSALLSHNVPLPGKGAQAPNDAQTSKDAAQAGKPESDFSVRIEGPGLARMKAALDMAWTRLIELVDELRKEMKPHG